MRDAIILFAGAALAVVSSVISSYFTTRHQHRLNRQLSIEENSWNHELEAERRRYEGLALLREMLTVMANLHKRNYPRGSIERFEYEQAIFSKFSRAQAYIDYSEMNELSMQLVDWVSDESERVYAKLERVRISVEKIDDKIKQKGRLP